MEKIIITADDFGISKEANDAIIECLEQGGLTNTCIMANGEGFSDAIEKIKNKNFNIGIHLNIIEGKSLIFKSNSSLTDNEGSYNLGYIKMLLKSFDKRFLSDVEIEFKSQIEKALMAGLKPDWLNSHVHVHSIPNIFNIVCKLADLYGIKNVRTQREIPYSTGEFKRHLNIDYILNIIKNLLLNFFTVLNRFTLKKYNLNTTDYFIGVLYTGNMDLKTIEKGLKKVPKNKTVEIILHPTTDKNKEKNYIEYQTMLNYRSEK